MPGAWRVHEDLIAEIPRDAMVETADVGVRRTRVVNSAGGGGVAWTMNQRSRPEVFEGAVLDGLPLRTAAGLVRSWNLAEASIGQAAINSWYSHPESAAEKGFAATGEGLVRRRVFDPFARAVDGGRVAVVGHFGFARKALGRAGEYYCLERVPQPGDHPDAACEYILPECDYVFISGSSFVNKTAPRLLEPSRRARTVLVGPSTPLLRCSSSAASTPLPALSSPTRTCSIGLWRASS